MRHVQLLVLLLAATFTLTGIYLLMTASLGMSFFCLVSAIACAVTHSLLERREHEQYL